MSLEKIDKQYILKLLNLGPDDAFKNQVKEFFIIQRQNLGASWNWSSLIFMMGHLNCPSNHSGIEWGFIPEFWHESMAFAVVLGMVVIDILPTVHSKASVVDRGT